jgi:hypothetical protein
MSDQDAAAFASSEAAASFKFRYRKRSSAALKNKRSQLPKAMRDLQAL